MSEVVIVIPARWASQRLPGKPLEMLVGATGKSRSLIARTVAAGQAVEGVSRLLVATDDARIVEEAKKANAEAVMTDPNARNGTERVADAIARLGISPDVVVNLQGDAPLTPHWFIGDLVQAMEDETIAVATPVLATDPEHLDRLRADRHAGRVGATTAVRDVRGNALYFSKEVLPFGGGSTVAVLHHVGVYAYRPKALDTYLKLPMAVTERAEGLEQLRFVENGIPVACVEVDPRGRTFWEVNTPEDIPRVEAIMQAEGLE